MAIQEMDTCTTGVTGNHLSEQHMDDMFPENVVLFGQLQGKEKLGYYMSVAI